MKPFHALLFLVISLVSGSLARAVAAPAGGQALADAEVMKRLEALRIPTLDNALVAARELRLLADSQQGAAKAATERLIGEIRNLFYGEMVVKKAKEGRVAAEQQAQAKERSAQDWLKPNVFGNVNHTAHGIDKRAAQTLRADAARQLTVSRDKLVEVVKATDEAIRDYDVNGHGEVGTVLERAMKSVVARSLQSADMDSNENGAFNKEMLAALTLLGLAWWASSGSQDFSAPSSQPATGFDWNQRARQMEEDARREQHNEREREIIRQQNRAMAEEAERGAARRAAEAEAAAQARAAAAGN